MKVIMMLIHRSETGGHAQGLEFLFPVVLVRPARFSGSCVWLRSSPGSIRREGLYHVFGVLKTTKLQNSFKRSAFFI